MTTRQRITRYILIVGSLLLAVANLPYPLRPVVSDTYTADILHALTFAFTPAVIGWVFARLHLWLKVRDQPDRYYFVWHSWWAGLLVLLVAQHLHAAWRSLPLT